MKINVLGIIMLLLCLNLNGQTNPTNIQESIAYQTQFEIWESFRHKFPFHLQTIGISEIENDDSFQIILSEPPPHVTLSGIKEFFSKHNSEVKTYTHQIGVDGWVKDVSIVLKGMSENEIEILIDDISEWFFHTSYKAHALNLSKAHLVENDISINYQVSVSELEDWLFVKNEKFYDRNNETLYLSTNEILDAKKSGVFYSSTPGLVVWSISKLDICEYDKEARQFALDTDLVLGAVEANDYIAIIGRERQLSLFNYPPLRTEMIMMLANANNDELAQSYERNQLFAGKLDNGKDWAPIYLSDELKHTEYGSLLNITDQLLKSWSQNGETDYEFFNYRIPTEWAFEKPLSKSLNTSGVTFNWNTNGATYLVSYDTYDITALNRTGALPISYFPEGSYIDEFSEQEARRMEGVAYDYFSSQNDPNLARVVQYAALYQIFSHYNVGCYSIKNFNISKQSSRESEQFLQKETRSLVDYLRGLDVDKALEELFDDYVPESEFEALVVYVFAIPEIRSMYEEMQKLLNDIHSEYGNDGLNILSYLVANPRDFDGLGEIEVEDLVEFDEDDLGTLLSSSFDFMDLYEEIKYDIDYFSSNKERIYKDLVSANSNSNKEWIKTPTILISWNVDSIVSIGGHSLDAEVVPFKVDNSLKKGQYRIGTDYDGNRMVYISKNDVDRINHSFLESIEQSPYGIQKFTGNQKKIELRQRDEVVQPVRYDKQNRITQKGKVNEDIQNDFRSIKNRNDYVVSESGKAFRTTEIDGEKFIHHYSNENILFPFRKMKNTDEIVNNMKNRKYSKDEVKVISFVDDFKTDQILNNNFRDRNIKHTIRNINDLDEVFSRNNQKSHFLFGHIEDDMIVFGKNQLKLTEIEKVAKENNTNVFFYGCKSSFSKNGNIKSGVADNIYSVEAANRLGYAVNKNKDMWGLFNDLAYKDMRIVISNEPMKNLGYMQTMAKNRNTAGVVAAIGATSFTGMMVLNCEDSDGDGICDEEQEDGMKNNK